MARNDINLTIGATSKEAEKSLKSFAKRGKKAISQVARGFNILEAAALTAVGVVAGRKILGGLKSVTDAAAIQEDAINSLNSALKISGKFSESASKDFQAFASSLQNSSRFGDELILENAALIQSLGALETDGLKGATQAAADMAAALGIDLTAAATLVGKAAAGEVGSFSRYGVVIKKGADNAETFANTLDALNSKFGGAALAQINTYSGAVEQLSNTYGDLLEEIGFAITENPILIEIIKETQTVFSELISTVNENKEVISEYVSTALKGLLGQLPNVIRLFKLFIQAPQGIVLAFSSATVAAADFVSAVLEINAAKKVVNALSDSFKFVTAAITGGLSTIFEFVSKIPGIDSAFGDVISGIEEDLEGLSETAFQSIGEDFAEDTKLILKGVREDALQTGDDVSKIFDPLGAGMDVLADTAEKLVSKISDVGIKAGPSFGNLEQASEESAKSIEDDFKFFEDLGFENLGDRLKDTVKQASEDDKISIGDLFTDPKKFAGQILDNIQESIGKLDTKDMFSGAAKGLNSALQGRKGAEALFSAGGAAAADAFAPGLGEAVGPLISELAKGKENAKAMIKEFAEAIPDVAVDIIEALAASADVLIDSLVESLITNGGIERIVIAIAEASPKIGIAIAEGMTIGPLQAIGERIAGAFGRSLDGIWNDLLGRLTATGEKIAMPFEEAGARIKEEFTPAVDALKNIGADVKEKINEVIEDLKEAFNPPWVEDFFDNLAKKPQWVQDLQDALDIGGKDVGGKVEGFFEDPLGTIGGELENLNPFAQGGMVPSGFPNDSFPARLTSGELVTPPDTTKNLFRMVDQLAQGGGAGGGNMTIQLQIGEKQLADVLVNLNKQGFRTA